jgi:hypothetical protein
MCNGMSALSERGTGARRRLAGQTVRAAIWKTPDDGPVVARGSTSTETGRPTRWATPGRSPGRGAPRIEFHATQARGVIARSRSALLLCIRKRPSRSLAVVRQLRTSRENLAASLARACLGGAKRPPRKAGQSRLLRRGSTPCEREREPGHVLPCAHGSGRSYGRHEDADGRSTTGRRARAADQPVGCALTALASASGSR